MIKMIGAAAHRYWIIFLLVSVVYAVVAWLPERQQERQARCQVDGHQEIQANRAGNPGQFVMKFCPDTQMLLKSRRGWPQVQIEPIDPIDPSHPIRIIHIDNCSDNDIGHRWTQTHEVLLCYNPPQKAFFLRTTNRTDFVENFKGGLLTTVRIP